MSYLQHIQRLNPVIDEPLVPWSIDGQTVGWLRPALARQLPALGTGFRADGAAGDGRLVFDVAPADFDHRSAALAATFDALRRTDPELRLLDEPYPVTAGRRDGALCTLDRGAVGCFGVRSFGQHVNGYTRSAVGYQMWVGRRARHRLVSPGALDQLVAGGLPHGIAPTDNLRKECMEEAGITPELAERAVPVAALCYNRMTDMGFRPDILFCYDLELPSDWSPRNYDGEVEEFHLLPIEAVMELVRETDEFKPNCNLVIIDFLVRHGLLTPEHEDYLEIVTGLHATPGLECRANVA